MAYQHHGLVALLALCLCVSPALSTVLNCANGGTCEINAEQEPYCECTEGYTGDLCQTAVTQVFSVN